MYEQLKISNQMCFPLYVCSKEIVRKYKPFLDELDLTYTQYIAMMVMWEQKEINVKELGNILYLDSGTLTPVLKKLESKGWVTRERSKTDERNLSVKITKQGESLQEQAKDIPFKMMGCVNLSENEAKTFMKLLKKINSQIK